MFSQVNLFYRSSLLTTDPPCLTLKAAVFPRHLRFIHLDSLGPIMLITLHFCMVETLIPQNYIFFTTRFYKKTLF